jgi:uncharacterized protein
MIDYEWDEDKRLSNLERHGLDFRSAYLVYENPRQAHSEKPLFR